MRKGITLTCLLALMAISAQASRARGGWYDYRQPDGTTLTVALRGTADFCYYATPDGRTLLRQPDGRLQEVTRQELALSEAAARSSAPRRLPPLRRDWDADIVYHQPVVLVAYSDRDFTMDNPQEYYDRLFNESGYNEGRGPGCVADYFRDQSAGLCKLQFDVYGPVKLTTPSTDTSKYGASKFRQAVETLNQEEQIDWNLYDWNADRKVDQVIIIYAGYGGNEAESEGKGYAWPNTSTFATLTLGEVTLTNYSASAELWANDRLCGIGTVCHEFSHSLGLPDLYPTNSSSTEYSVVDEWDLMDGGNFINNGWCPCNYSAYEKSLLGWMQLEPLDEAATITDLKPVSEGGKAYIVSHTAQEFLVLENRQWTGWDLRTPGHGLMIAHVDGMVSAGNSVNNVPSHHRYDYFHADNLDYNDWDKLVVEQHMGRVEGHSPYLQTTPYPYVGESGTNNALTDQSVPAAQMFNANEAGSKLLAKPITDITMSPEGLLSFNFMGGTLSVINHRVVTSAQAPVYDLMGRRVAQPRKGGLYVRNKQLYLSK